MSLWQHVITELSLPLGISCEKVTPVNNEEYSLEGSSVTLSYKYSQAATGNHYFFWYRQYPGKPPEFIISISGSNNTKTADSLKSEKRFFTELYDKKRGVRLQISSAAVTDSALYYCAVRPTVTANPQSLYKNLTAPHSTFTHFNSSFYSTTAPSGGHWQHDSLIKWNLLLCLSLYIFINTCNPAHSELDYNFLYTEELDKNVLFLHSLCFCHCWSDVVTDLMLAPGDVIW